MYNNSATANVNMNPVGGGNDDDSDESGSGWISWFCDLEGHEFFIEVSLISKEITLNLKSYF